MMCNNVFFVEFFIINFTFTNDIREKIKKFLKNIDIEDEM